MENRNVAKAKAKKLEVRVTKEHIQHGVSSTTGCPIALAVREAKNLKHGRVWVGRRILVANGISYRMPLKAKNFIFEFDTGGFCKPFSFTAVRN